VALLSATGSGCAGGPNAAEASGQIARSDSASALLARAIDFAGGAPALARATALAWDGDAVVHAGGRTVDITGRWAIQPPDTAIVATYAVARGAATTRSLVVAAPRGWTVSGERFTPLTEAMLANERDAFYLYSVMRLVPLREPGVRLVTLPADSAGNAGFGARQRGRPDVDVYVDGEGRVVRLRTTVAHPITGAPARQELHFSGTIAADAIRWPRTLRITLDGAPYFDLHMRNLRVLSRLDDPLLSGPR
jgi:hypothetical protein